MSMVIRVQTRNPIGPQIWSWVVVGAAITLGLATGVAFTTSGHPWIADAFYVFSAVLFVAKFFTWEDIRQQEAKRRRRANSLAVAASVVVLALAIGGNHYLNPSSTNSAAPSQTPQTNTLTQNQPEREPASKPPASSETNETKDQVRVGAQHHAPKDEVRAQVGKGRKMTDSKSSAPPITINNAPNGIAISGGSVSNPTVNNFGSPSRAISPDLRESLRVSLAKHAATVRVYSVNDMEANEFAQQLYDLLAAAGWTMKDKQVILVQLGRPWRGVRVGYRGVPPADEKGLVSVPGDTPEEALVSALMSAKTEGISVNPKPDLEENFIELLVSSNPRRN